MQEHKTLGREIVLTALRKEEKVEGETEAVEESVPLQRRIILILFIKSRSRC